MQQMTARQGHMEKVISDHHAQHTAQVQSLQGQMAAQLDVQRVRMSDMFKEQMAHIESLINRNHLPHAA